MLENRVLSFSRVTDGLGKHAKNPWVKAQIASKSTCLAFKCYIFLKCPHVKAYPSFFLLATISNSLFENAEDKF